MRSVILLITEPSVLKINTSKVNYVIAGCYRVKDGNSVEREDIYRKNDKKIIGPRSPIFI
jgi:hypothetical protein